MGVEEPRARIDFSVGENIRVIAGPFENFIGLIDEIYIDKGKVRVIISMFGRETPIELDFIQVEKIS
jgi:transcriptional antiterminator NusG